MTNSAGVTDFKTEKQVKEVHLSDNRIRPHIAYLDFLKKHDLLDQAIEETLPAHVVRAAKVAVASDLLKKHGPDKIRVFKNTEGEIAISVDAEGKDLEQEEVNDYIKHYNLERFVRRLQVLDQFRQIDKGQKYEVKSGSFINRIVLVSGLDKESFGVEWHENYQHPLCENHLSRVQRDALPMRGRTFVCKLLDEDKEVLIHESEIGLHII